jgi:hypothetical protein
MLHRIPGMLPAEQACTKLRDMQIARTLSNLRQAYAALRRSHDAVGHGFQLTAKA